jgi:hypothetical protein
MGCTSGGRTLWRYHSILEGELGRFLCVSGRFRFQRFQMVYSEFHHIPRMQLFRE